MTSHVLQAPRKVGSRPTWMQAKRSLPDLGGQEVTTASLRIKTPFGTTENHTCWRIVALEPSPMGLACGMTEPCLELRAQYGFGLLRSAVLARAL